MAVGSSPATPPPVLLIGGAILAETGTAAVGSSGSRSGGKDLTQGFGMTEDSEKRDPFKSFLGGKFMPQGFIRTKQSCILSFLLSLLLIFR